MSKRLYLGRLSADCRSEDVNELFKGYGQISDCRVMTGFGFVEFETAKDAEDAVHEFNGKTFMGNTIVVEFAKESRPRREPAYEDRSYGPPRSRRPAGVRLIVSDVSRDTSWQDLKDFGREAGSVSFADIDRDHPGQGILEYLSRDDAERAVKELDGRDLRGRPVRVALDDSRGGPDNYRRDDRREDRPYRDSHRDDRRDTRDDRYRDDRPPRRDRSRSPPRRDYDDRRPRSDAHRRPEGYDSRSRGYDSERRTDFERRSDDGERRRDDRRPPREDGDDRRATKSTGDGGWAR